MQQIIMNSQGARVARMPVPTVDKDSVLVEVKYSMISVGTEIGGLQLSNVEQEVISAIKKAKTYSGIFKSYLSKSVRNPGLALNRVSQLVKSKLVKPQLITMPVEPIAVDNLTWTQHQAKQFVTDNGVFLLSDESAWGYQAITSAFNVSEDHALMLEFQGELKKGKLCIGFLDQSMQWIANQVIDAGRLDERIVFESKKATIAYVIITNAEGGESELRLSKFKVSLLPPDESGLPHNELQDQGWNVGYSAVGKIIAVGSDIDDLCVGEIVACAGAGKANHAQFINVPRNLVVRVPQDCDLKAASSTTIGTIALQGIRQASPNLGETIVVLGLGLLGQLTVQMLKANGCQVIGMDLDETRVKRAIENGMDDGSVDIEKLKKICRNATAGYGADRVLITAATKSNAVVNLAMELCRRKGTVVIVGDVGMNIERPNFYKKEITLLISSSYGPGRYDAAYEEEGQDYPYAYVRWTLNRNMQSYLELIRAKKINVNALIDQVAKFENAAMVYEELVTSNSNPPLAVVFEYPDEDKAINSIARSQIILRGHKKPHLTKINYALVGAGAFGTCMLVPQMAKAKDMFFLRAVVSKDAIRGGNFARQNGVEIFTANINDIANNPEINLLVIATRHNDHTMQTIAGLKSGKHVFVEKPLALSWQDLDDVINTYTQLDERPLLMVGFNRRFSPAMQHLKQELADRKAPMMINYRLNGGYIPLDSWLQGKRGGGRNIGEACHMYDCFRFLTNAKVKNIQASAINPGELPYLRNDNFVAVITYEDGSVANLMYTASGPKQGLPKERVEVFCDGEAYLIDDYKALIRCQDNKTLWSGDVDKGHFTELKSLGEAIINGGESPVSFEEIIETTAVSLYVEDLLFGR